MKINLLDLFSGIGGFHKGLSQAGFQVNSYFSEVDKYAIEVYKHNFKTSQYVGSVTDVRESQLPRIDAITFGSPCQDFSLAGKRKGMAGERSSLIFEAIRLIQECRPRFFIWENVKGTFSSNAGEDFAAILQAFANIGGYRIEWQLLNTKWFLPQNRERVYLVGYTPKGSRGQIFPIRKGNATNTTSKREGDTSACITATYGRGVAGGRQHIKIKSATKKGYEIAREGDSINYTNINSKTRRGRVGKEISQTLDTKCNQAVIGDFRYDEGYRERKDGNSPCLASRKHSETDISTMSPLINKIRRLTPIECERLQGFPDNWTKEGTEGLISDSQRYKMCGNAVTVDVVEAVAKQIIKTI